jgi:hypothetical protein
MPTEWIPDGAGPCEDYVDSDGDTIPDSIEGTDDPDGDSVPNFMDEDSDGDTFPDAVEAGDDDLCTHPANSDWGFDSSGNPVGDEVPDFLDEDSDDDELTDAEERECGTNPCDRDTDGDGMTDKNELCMGSDPLDPTSTIDPDWIFVVLGYMAHEHEEMDFTFLVEGDAPLDVTLGIEDCTEPIPDHCADYWGSPELTCCVQDSSPESAIPDAPEGFASMDDSTFYGVNPGTEVTFRLDLYNDCAPQLEECPQIRRMCISALGSDGSGIGTQEFYIVVPMIPTHEW